MDEQPIPTAAPPPPTPLAAEIQSSDLEGRAIEEKRTKMVNDPRFRLLTPKDQHSVLLQRDPVYAHAMPDEQKRMFSTIREQIINGAVKDYATRVPDKTGTAEETKPDDEVMTEIKKGAAEMIGLGTETVGGVAGAMRGASIGSKAGPVGAVVGGIAGAALGSAAGTVARQPTDVAGGLHPAKSGTELLKDVAVSAVTGAGAEGAGRALIAGWNKAIYEPLGRYLTTGKLSKTTLTPEQEALNTQAERIGVTLRPSEVTGSDQAGMVEQTVRRSLFGRNYFEALDVTNEAALRGNMDTLAARFIQPQTMSKMEAGALLQDTIQKKSTPLFRAAETQYYKRVKDLAGADGVQVDGKEVLPAVKQLMTTVDAEVQPHAAALLRRMENLLTEDVVTQSAPKGSGIPTKSKTVPRQLDWMDAQDMRSMLLELGRSKELLKDREQGLANTAAGKMREAMESTAQTAGSDVYRLWREAQEFSKKGHDVLGDSTIKRIVTMYPEDAVGTLFKKEAITENKRLVDALTYAGTDDANVALNGYRRAAMDSLITKASTDGFLTGRSLYNAVYGKQGVGKEVMDAVFELAYLNELNKTLDVAKRMNMSTSAGSAGNPSQTGRSLVNWFEQSMLINIPADFAKHALKGEFGAGLANAAANIQQAGVYILSMKEAGSLLNSKDGLKILRDGLQMGEKGEQAWRVTGQLLGHVIKDAASDIQEGVTRMRDSETDPKAGELVTAPRTELRR